MHTERKNIPALLFQKNPDDTKAQLKELASHAMLVTTFPI